MKKIIYTGAFRFPDKDAASQRVLGIAKSLREYGVEVVFCGWEKEARKEDRIDNEKYFYQGFEYYSMNELDLHSRHIIDRLKNFIFRGDKTIRWLKKYIKNNKVDCIIAYNGNSLFLYNLHKLCTKNKIKLIADCTEWYEGNHLPGGRYGLANLDNNLRIKKIYPLIKNIILISRYLNDFYEKKGCKTLIVPPLVDLSEDKWNIPNEYNNIKGNPIKLIYAGDPGKKDLLENIFFTLKKINSDNYYFHFCLLGVSKRFIEENYFHNSSIPYYIEIVGRVDMKEVPKFYKNNDFSILIRENKRYANAGFPTKFVESFASGTPVIANITSDLDKYLKNNETGFILKDGEVDSLLNCFEKIKESKRNNKETMRVNVKSVAKEKFDYRKYSDVLIKFC